ncbi:unnamed protein product [Alopecurus aequalis]
MAFPAPAAVFLDENLPIHRGKRADGLNAKPLKPSARKALRDVSNTSKPLVPGIKGTALKDRSVLKGKSALRSQETIKKNPVNRTTIFTDQETKNCHEWAKGGVEGTHFTGNDAQKLDKDKLDKRVKKKVEKITSALHAWSDVIFDPLLFPAKSAPQSSRGYGADVRSCAQRRLLACSSSAPWSLYRNSLNIWPSILTAVGYKSSCTVL